MNFYDFIEQDELENLPEDPKIAFAEFVRIATPRLRKEVSRWDGNNEDGWYSIHEAQHGFVNVTVAVAKQLGIEPFASVTMPRFDRKNPYPYDEFKYDLDHYVTQIAMDNVVRARRDTVHIATKAKDRIRAHLHGLRACVENSSMSGVKKEALLKRLDDFEKELEKRRVSLLSVTLVTMTVLGLPGGVWASGEMVAKLAGNILSIVGEAKSVEDEERRLGPVGAPKTLSAPRPAEPNTIKQTGGYAGRPSNDMDDEIPF